MVVLGVGEMGVGGGRGSCLRGTEFQFDKVKTSEGRWWGWLHISEDMLNATELYT